MTKKELIESLEVLTQECNDPEYGFDCEKYWSKSCHMIMRFLVSEGHEDIVKAWEEF